MTELDYIFGTPEEAPVAGYLEFTDGSLLLVPVDEEYSGSELSTYGEPQLLPDEGWDSDDIPF